MAEVTNLLSILIGRTHAGILMRGVLDFLETGCQETWYDRQLRRRYGGESVRNAQAILGTPRGVTQSTPYPGVPNASHGDQVQVHHVT